jgi:hypothetical protein
MNDRKRIGVVLQTCYVEKTLENTGRELSECFEEASSINFRRSVKFGLEVLSIPVSFAAHKLGVVRSARFTKSGRKVTQHFYSQ